MNEEHTGAQLCKNNNPLISHQVYIKSCLSLLLTPPPASLPLGLPLS